ncbi:Peptidase A1 domain-containing protein [Aphelenchoides bicaudatus]|nr:Peptidase A1 domain-containing protein [Aphelenchoides bicaudatus]
MNRTCLVFVILFVAKSSSVLELPFKNAEDGVHQAIVDVQIGTPAQSFKLSLGFLSYCPGLIVYSTKTHKDGFDATASSSFKRTGDYKEGLKVVGSTGTDNLQITDSSGKPQNLVQKPLTVIDDGFCVNLTTLSLARSTSDNPNSFVDSVLSTETDKIATLKFDKLPDNNGNLFGISGLISLGSRLPDFCSSKWNTFIDDPTEFGYNWQFKIDRIATGKFASTQVGHVHFRLDTGWITLGPDVYDQVANELQVSNYEMPCDAGKDIVLTINGFELHVKPEDYMGGNVMDTCLFRGNRGYDNDSFELPNTIFKRYCLMFDYQNGVAGLADKL